MTAINKQTDDGFDSTPEVWQMEDAHDGIAQWTWGWVPAIGSRYQAVGKGIFLSEQDARASMESEVAAMQPGKPIWAGEYNGTPHWAFGGLRGFISPAGAVRCLPGNEWRHDPLSAEEIAALDAARAAAESSGWDLWA